MSDKEVLLSMGFDTARVECESCVIAPSEVTRPSCLSAGALKATSNRGLQPAMDFILENQDKPVPDLSSVSSSSTSQPARTGGDEDDDEDVEALKAIYGHKGGVEAQSAAADAAADAEAKVRVTPHTTPPTG